MIVREIELTAWEETSDGGDMLLPVNVEYLVEYVDDEDGKMGRAIEIIGATYQDENDNEVEYHNVRVNELDWIDEILRIT